MFKQTRVHRKPCHTTWRETSKFILVILQSRAWAERETGQRERERERERVSRAISNHHPSQRNFYLLYRVAINEAKKRRVGGIWLTSSRCSRGGFTPRWTRSSCPISGIDTPALCRSFSRQCPATVSPRPGPVFALLGKHSSRFRPR